MAEGFLEREGRAAAGKTAARSGVGWISGS